MHPGQAVLAAPLYQLIGVRAFFLLNAAGALFTLWLCYRIALLLFEDEDLALNAALVLVLATFVVDYAFAIWPHCLALALMTLAFYCVLRAWRGEGSGFLAMLLAGGALGLAITIRVDAAIAVGAQRSATPVPVTAEFSDSASCLPPTSATRRP